MEIDLLLIPAPPLISFSAAHETKLFAMLHRLAGFLRFTRPSTYAIARPTLCRRLYVERAAALAPTGGKVSGRDAAGAGRSCLPAGDRLVPQASGSERIGPTGSSWNLFQNVC